MLKKQLIGMFFIFCSVITYAQIEIKGGVYDEYLEPFYNAKITIKTESTTTFTDGKFALKTLRKLPVTLIISAFGYQTEKRIIRSLDTPINIILKESLLLDQIVISASRISEKIIESPSNN
ncbi:carboxypeptidase-like regulatory domain-containing protein [Tenacibaculum finnmarkense]|nr:carboxypeptidase-like regulatory domain-containing protein [Tenacibaculum finnmarkense]